MFGLLGSIAYGEAEELRSEPKEKTKTPDAPDIVPEG